MCVYSECVYSVAQKSKTMFAEAFVMRTQSKICLSVRSVCLYVCLCVCLSVSACLSVCLSVCLPACLPACLSVCLSVHLSVCPSVCGLWAGDSGCQWLVVTVVSCFQLYLWPSGLQSHVRLCCRIPRERDFLQRSAPLLPDLLHS